jgi:hypothetical protein
MKFSLLGRSANVTTLHGATSQKTDFIITSTFNLNAVHGLSQLK